jgi:hypothetical protein
MINSLFVGILRATRSWKMIMMLLAANILCALPLALPIFLLVAQTTSGTMATDKMFADKLDVNWITDIFNHQIPGSGLETSAFQVGLLALVMGVSYLLITTLFTGGILEVLTSEDERFTMRRFWAGCGAYFWRFFRLTLISLVFYGVACLIFLLARWPIERAARQATEYESVVHKRWAVMLLLVLLVAFVNMVFDYARIGTVISDSRKMFGETIRATRFAWLHFWSAYALYILIAIVGIIIFLVFTLLRDSISQSSLLAVLVAIVVGQLAIASRIWTRLTFYAAELDLYKRLVPIALPAHITPPEEKIEFISAVDGSTEPPDNDSGSEGAII